MQNYVRAALLVYKDGLIRRHTHLTKERERLQGELNAVTQQLFELVQETQEITAHLESLAEADNGQ